MLNTLVLLTYLDVRVRLNISDLRLLSDRMAFGEGAGRAPSYDLQSCGSLD